MSILVQLKPEIEARIRTEAEAQGLSIEKYVASVLEGVTGRPQTPFYATASPQEWARAFRAWAQSHDRALPLLSDEAVSREGIYCPSTGSRA
ncbi:MAG: hypothetical protein FJ279_30175 [Planctomycetes bacterium]|nr:hypothetical protein [Planctomycetota bacterium]